MVILKNQLMIYLVIFIGTFDNILDWLNNQLRTSEADGVTIVNGNQITLNTDDDYGIFLETYVGSAMDLGAGLPLAKQSTPNFFKNNTISGNAAAKVLSFIRDDDAVYLQKNWNDNNTRNVNDGTFEERD